MKEIAPDFPAVLHGDVAGVIEAVGEGVSVFQPGDEVYACAGGVKGLGGALAEFLLADAALVAKKPTSLSMREVVALPLVSITAWEGLIDRAKVQAGQNVLIYGATGGVGHIGISLVHIKGLTLHVFFMLIPMLHGIGLAHHGEILSKLAHLVDEGKVRPLIDPKSFSFSEIAEAHQYAESGQAIGKVALTQQFKP